MFKFIRENIDDMGIESVNWSKYFIVVVHFVEIEQDA